MEFKDLGAEVIEASSLEDAEKALKDGQFTHVVCDGLGGDWERLSSQVGETKFRLVSGSAAVAKRAEEVGIECVDKFDISMGNHPVGRLINN